MNWLRKTDHNLEMKDCPNRLKVVLKEVDPLMGEEESLVVTGDEGTTAPEVLESIRVVEPIEENEVNGEIETGTETLEIAEENEVSGEIGIEDLVKEDAMAGAMKVGKAAHPEDLDTIATTSEEVLAEEEEALQIFKIFSKKVRKF